MWRLSFWLYSLLTSHILSSYIFYLVHEVIVLFSSCFFRSAKLLSFLELSENFTNSLSNYTNFQACSKRISLIFNVLLGYFYPHPVWHLLTLKLVLIVDVCTSAPEIGCYTALIIEVEFGVWTKCNMNHCFFLFKHWMVLLNGV